MYQVAQVLLQLCQILGKILAEYTFLGGFHKTLCFFLRPFFIAMELLFILFIYRLEQFVVFVKHLRKYWSFNKASS